MENLYIHIGSNKTGSTSIQSFLLNNAEDLSAQNICFPLIGLTPNGAHHYLAASLYNKSHPRYKSDSDFAEYSSKILDASSIHLKTIISSEFLWNLDIDINALKVFSERYNNTKIIVYLRRQDEYLNSFYNSIVKTGKKGGVNSIDKISKNFYLDYNTRLEHWAKIFGESNLIVKLYNKKYFVGGDLIKDFCSHIDYSISTSTKFVSGIRNTSASFKAIEILRILDKLNVHTNQSQRNRIIKLFSNENNPPKLSNSAAISLLNRHESPNTKLGKWFGRPGENPFSYSVSEVSKKDYIPPTAEEAIKALLLVTSR